MVQQRTELQALIEELGGASLPGLDRLPASAVRALTDAVRSARRQQQQQLARALEAALAHLPALLRGPVRKILLPD